MKPDNIRKKINELTAQKALIEAKITGLSIALEESTRFVCEDSCGRLWQFEAVDDRINAEVDEGAGNVHFYPALFSTPEQIDEFVEKLQGLKRGLE